MMNPTTTPPAINTRPLQVFMVGNSFASNATQFLPQLAQEGGHPLQLGSARIGGCSLQTHWEWVEAAELAPDAPQNKPYEGRSLREWLESQTWDIVTLQQASIVSSDSTSYRPYARQLWDFVRHLQPGAEIVWHQTWAYHARAQTFGGLGNGQNARDQREMWLALRAAYHAAAAQTGARIIPVGEAFWKVNSDPKYPAGGSPDFNFDLKYPEPPAQPNSLHRGVHWFPSADGAWKMGFDPAHANEAGCYLGALVWYGFLFGESPEKLRFAPPEVPAAFAAHLRRVAWQVVCDGIQNKF